MSSRNPEEEFFERLAAENDSPREFRASSRLKSKVYSALVNRQASSGPLLSVLDTRDLCVFEQSMKIAPVGKRIKELNYCRVCHARVLGERVESAPIFWCNCPYVGFQNR